MVSRLFVATLVVIVCSGVGHGQAADPLSGLWGRKDGAGLDLRFDGRTGVTGTVYVTGVGGVPIRTGTFDPATRRLKVEGAVTAPDGRNVPFLIEGTFEGDALSLAYDFGGEKGTASLPRDGVAPASPAVTNAAPALAKSFKSVSALVLESAEMVPADKYAYRPVPSVRTFGQLVAHIADAYNYSCAHAAGRAVEWADPIERGDTGKAALAAKLKAASDACAAVLDQAVNLDALVEAVAHTNLHYGNIVTYMRMLGLTPPSS